MSYYILSRAAVEEQIAVERHMANLKLLVYPSDVPALRELAETRMREEIEASKVSASPARPLSQILAEIVDRVAAGREP